MRSIQRTVMPDQPIKNINGWRIYIHNEVNSLQEGSIKLPIELRLSSQKRQRLINLFRNQLKIQNHG